MYHRLLILVLAFTVACGSATPNVPATIAPLATHTATALPSATPQATATPAPTATPEPTSTPQPTPYPPLQTEGPYLAYLKRKGEQQTLVLLDADGVGRKFIPLPAGAYVQNLKTAISPDGKWLAFHTSAEPDASSRYMVDVPTLELKLMRLADGEVRSVAQLGPKDFPKNFEIVADWVEAQTSDDGRTREEMLDSIQDVFLAGITALAWSPDGRSLSFAGALDGPSSDLYVYQIASGKIYRLSDGLEQIQWITWSPNSVHIIYTSANFECMGSCASFNLASLGSITSQKLDVFDNVIYGWVSSSYFITHRNENIWEENTIHLIDVNQNTTSTIWPTDFTTFAIDSSSNTLAVATRGMLTQSGSDDPIVDAGFYFADLRTGRIKKSITAAPVSIFNWPNGSAPFLFFGFANNTSGLFALALDGTATHLNDFCCEASLSPDGASMAILNTQNDTLIVNTQDFSMRRSAVPYQLKKLWWRPDGAGFYFLSKTNLYYAPVLDQPTRLIDRVLGPGEYAWAFSAAWVNP